MAPPAKRRKRTVVDSDDEDDQHDNAPKNNPETPRKSSLRNYFSASPSPNLKTAGTSSTVPISPSPLRRQSTATAGAAPASPSPLRRQSHPVGANGANGTPSKRIATRGKKKEDSVKSGNLMALFTKQAETQKINGVPKRKVAEETPADELTSDPISDDDDFGTHRTTATSLVGGNARKRLVKNGSNGSTSKQPTPAGSQMFMKPPQLRSANSIDDDLRPWSERFAPQNLDELVVHKKKVADVRTWLEDVMRGRLRQRLLVLKGAAGTAKTTTLRLLAKDMGCDILEWRNPAGFMGGSHGYASASAQFEEFMNRGSKFGQLELDTEGSSTASTASTAGLSPKKGAVEDKGQKIILIEEFPNTFTRSSNTMTGFRSTVMRYLAANTPSLAMFGQHQKEDITPVVMIISETLLTTTSASADSFTAYRLLGQEILGHPGTALIEFNTIAPTLMAKALQQIVLKEARKSGRRRTPGPQVLQRLGEIGDIRNAIGTLEFLCVKGDSSADWGSKVAFTKPKKAPSKDQALTKGEEESLELVSQREASLGIFHAVGKVMYNKREEAPSPAGSEHAEAETLPQFLAQCARPKKSIVGVDTLIDETGTDTHTFISAIHENYALSCEASHSDPKSSLDYISGCLEYLSASDLLCPSSDSFFGGRGYGGGGYGRDVGGHIMRQDELAFHVAVRGTLFSLPVPVKRGGSSGAASRGDQFKMFYPSSIKLWRAKEELGDLLDIWSTKILKGEVTKAANQPLKSITQGAAAFKKAKGGNSVGDWVGNRSELAYMAAKKASAAKAATSKDEEEEVSPLLSLGSSARKEMLLERLPYMAHIARRKQTTFCSMPLRDLEKVVSFQGTGRAAAIGEEEAEEQDEDNEAVPGETWATDKSTEEPTPKKRRGIGSFKSRRNEDESQGSGTSNGLGLSRLVIEDDDIEDDW